MAKRSEKSVLFLCTGNHYRSRFAGGGLKSSAAGCNRPPANPSAALAERLQVERPGDFFDQLGQAANAPA